MMMATTTSLSDAIINKDAAQVKTLMQGQPDLARTGQGPQGEPLLHLAVSHGNPEIVAFLLEQGADIDARRTGGFTPLHDAARQGNEEMIKLLLEHMADINATTDDGQTPMELAIKSGHDAAKWFSL
jgi:ankyrin repeat protein